MTARSLAYQKSTAFPLIGTPSDITVTQMQDLIDTVDVRTGGLLGGGTPVRVTDPEFGADPTGSSDSTTAFQSAMAKGPAIVPFFQTDGTTRAVYRVSNCAIPSGASLLGMGPPGYIGISDTTVKPRIIGATNATRLFDAHLTSGALLQGLFIDGSNSTTPNTADGISAGSMSLTMRDCLVAYCNNGLGGVVAGSSSAFPNGSWICNLYNNVFQNCLIGINAVEDTFIFGGSLTTCGTGLLIPSGYGGCTIIGTRIEWCGRTGQSPAPASGYGIRIQGDSVQITGCQFDANGGAGIYFDGGFMCSVVNSHFQRNGQNLASAGVLLAGSCHVLFNVAFSVYIRDCTSRAGGDGKSPQTFSPQFFATFTGAAGNNGGIMFVGNDMSGYSETTTSTAAAGPFSSNTLWRSGNVPVSSGVNAYVVVHNIGTGTAAQDIDTR